MSSIDVKLAAQTSGYRRDIKEAKAETLAFKADLERGGGVLAGFIGKVGGVIAGLGIANAFQSIVDKADDLQDLSDRFDVPVEALQKMGLVAEQNGSSMEAMAVAYGKLDIAIDKALGGNSQMIAQFQELGISLEDLQSLQPEQIMEKIGQSSMRSSAMVAVLGKAALELRPTLEQLKDAEVGGIIKAEDVAVLAQFKDDCATISNELTKWGAIIGGGALKAMRDLQDFTASTLNLFQQLFQGKSLVDSFTGAIGFFGDQQTARDDEQRKKQKEAEDRKNRRRKEAEETAEKNNKQISKAEQEVKKAEENEANAKGKAELDRMGKELDENVKRRGMSGAEIAQARRTASQAKRDQARADREFIREHGGGEVGKSQLEEVKRRNDPVAQAEKAREAAQEKLNGLLQGLAAPLQTIADSLEEGDME